MGIVGEMDINVMELVRRSNEVSILSLEEHAGGEKEGVEGEEVDVEVSSVTLETGDEGLRGRMDVGKPD